MQDLRIVLIVVGVIMIVALLAHGYFSNRKNSNQQLDAEGNAQHSKAKKASGNQHQSADELSMGRKSIIGEDPIDKAIANASNKTPETLVRSEPQLNTEQVLKSGANEKSEQALKAEEQLRRELQQRREMEQKREQARKRELELKKELAARREQEEKDSLASIFQSEDPAPAPSEQEPSFSFSALNDALSESANTVKSMDKAQPRTETAKALADSAPETPVQKSERESHNEEQAFKAQAQEKRLDERAFEPAAEPEDEDELSQESEADKPKSAPDDVYVLHVSAQKNRPIQGEALLDCLASLGLQFGDMDIFHRHSDKSNNSPTLFSLANMMNPGTFDIDDMENFETSGVVVFMTVPCHGSPISNFNLMFNTAKTLAKNFNAVLLDDQRKPLSKQTLYHYEQRVREYERKQLVR